MEIATDIIMTFVYCYTKYNKYNVNTKESTNGILNENKKNIFVTAASTEFDQETISQQK